METNNRPGPSAGVPCGHDADVIRLRATESHLSYCCRCERGFEIPAIEA